MNLHEAIKKVREHKDLKQSQVANIAGISREQYGAIERGDVDPRMGTVVKILDAMGMTMVIKSWEDTDILLSL